MKIKTLVVSPFEVNCYLVWDESGKTGVIIDPGDEEELIFDQVKQAGFEPSAILLTHGHGDHIGAVRPVKDKYEIPIYIGQKDASMLQNPSANVSAIFGYQIVCPAAEHEISDGQSLKFGGLEFTVLNTPGHTPGGVCFLAGNHLFCGDTLFQMSVGRTDLPGGNFQTLIESINENLLTLSDDIICYPGHGPVTSIGSERKNNPFISGRRFV